MKATPRPSRERYWSQVRAADGLLRDVAASGNPSLPGAVEAFDDAAAVLIHLAARWSRDLAGSLDPILDLPDAERDRAAADVAAALAARRPALHAVLRHHADHPAVRAARSHDRARAGLHDAPVHAEHVVPRPRGSLLARCPVHRAFRAAAAA